MASKNNNTDTLASDIDDDPTAELETLADTFVAQHMRASPRESDERTHSFDSEDDSDERPVAELRSDLRTRDASIEKLQYDIEQLRSRWTGLEKEIQAREQLTKRLNGELRELKSALAERDQRIEVLRERLADADAGLNAATEEAGARTARIAVLEMQQASDANAIRMLEADLERARARSETVQQATSPELAELRQKLKESRHRLADLAHYVEGRGAAWRKQEADLADRNRLLADYAREIESLSMDLSESRTTADRHAGGDAPELHAGCRATMDELVARLERTEAYADTLRQQWQDVRRAAADRDARQVELQQTLDNALERIAELRAELELEQDAKALVETQRDDLERRRNDDVARRDHEIGETRDALREQRATAEGLAAELELSETAARDLRERLDALEERFDTERAALQGTIERQHRQLDEYRDKVETKNNAITALLSELASKRSAMDSLSEIGHVVHNLDDRMTASFDERRSSDATDRERSTRLLVGTIEGQELRFPLFKEQLSIGRSADNDIQLKVQSISRRHATIISDNGGCRIIDRHSRNGIYVNGRRVMEAALASGDKLVIGSATLVFEERARR